MYETHLGADRHTNHGERVVRGQRFIQSATDIFVGWTSARGNDFYVRQFRDSKVIPESELIAPRLTEFASKCGAVLARAYARTGDPLAINGYIGKGRRFDQALAEFANDYADRARSPAAGRRDRRPNDPRDLRQNASASARPHNAPRQRRGVRWSAGWAAVWEVTTA